MKTTSHQPLGIAIVGAGTVGGGVLELLHHQKGLLERQCGRPLRVVGVAKRDPSDCAHIPEIYRPLLTTDWRACALADETDVVVELVGGETIAAECISAALAAGKAVVTANKALLAEMSCHGDDDLFAQARDRNLPLAHEAAVAGCVPVIKVLRETLAGDSIYEICGVVNGTCNFILTRMEQEWMTFAEALEEAQQLGYAEADPTFDIDGIDSAHKLVLMARWAFGAGVSMSEVAPIGIRHLDLSDIRYAARYGFRVKLLAIAKQCGEDQLHLRVGPTLIPNSHLLGSVEGAKNAVVLHSHFAGETMLYGAGAGAHPTAVAVVSDIIDVARGNNGFAPLQQAWRLEQSHVAPFYLRLRVLDRPGVLAEVTRVLAERAISIEAIHQNESAPEQTVDVVILLHDTEEAKVRESLSAIEGLETVVAPGIALPVERLLK